MSVLSVLLVRLILSYGRVVHHTAQGLKRKRRGEFLRRLRSENVARALVTSRVLVAARTLALAWLGEADADNSGEAHFRVL